MRRIMGIETEYGVLAPGDPGANPMLLSAQVVTAYAADGVPGGAHARWDYQDEDPLCDARGWRVDRSAAHPSQLTDRELVGSDGEVEPGLGEDAGPGADIGSWQVTARNRATAAPDTEVISNVILPNGARYYVDHAHPEYSGPEVTNPRDAIIWDKAGDEIALRSTRLLAQRPGMPEVALYKNNTDGKGASYGTHENYLMDRRVRFADVITMLLPFLATRPVVTGAGRVGLGQSSEGAGFQLSQRADFIEADVGLETTLRRPIVNTRDEPHADAQRFRRLHVIVGDANQMEVPIYLKLGTTSLVLWLLEQEGVRPQLASLALADPVAAARAVSHDLTLTQPLDLADGRQMTAIEIQRQYLEAVSAGLAQYPAPEAANAHADTSADVLRRWSNLLERLAQDPSDCAREVEWVAKLRVLEGMRRRDQLDWRHPRLAALDLQWSDLRPERSVYHKLVAAGAVERLVTDADIDRALTHPPADTRAYFRGECIRRFGPQVSSANWDAVIFDIPGRRQLQRVPTPDPYRGTASQLADLFERVTGPEHLLQALAG